MTMNQARLTLIVVFLGSLTIQLVAFFSVSQYMWPEDLQALVLKLLAVYSVHVGVIAGGIFAQSGIRTSKPSTITTVSAILLALMWNGLLISRSSSFVISREDSATSLVEYLKAVADYGSFLVVASVAFFFTRNSEKTAHRSR